MAPGNDEVRLRVQDPQRIVEAIAELDKAGVLGRHDAPKAETLQRLFTGRCEVPLAQLLSAIWPDAPNEDAALNLYRGFKKRVNKRMSRLHLDLVMCSQQDNRPVASKLVWFEEALSAQELARSKEDEEARRAAEVIQREHKREFEGTPSREYVPQEVTIGLPAVRFPDTLTRFAEEFFPTEWKALAPEDRTFLSNLCTKLEPIVQIVPQTPVPLVLGFECLTLGMNGQAFGEIEKRFAGKLSPALLRLLVTLANFESASSLRSETRLAGKADPQQLLFTINLDPEMLANNLLERFLDVWRDRWQANVLFEVNEDTATAHVKRIKQLVVDFGLRLCLDDANKLDKDVRDALAGHAELSKLDHKAFQALMGRRETSPETIVAQIASHRLAGKPLLVEGVEDDSHLRFLRRHWRPGEFGPLQGQGHALTPGHPWDGWTADLRSFGLKGGHILASPSLAEASRIVREFVPPEHHAHIRSQNQGRVFRISIPGNCFGGDKSLVLGVLSERPGDKPAAKGELPDLDFVVVKERLSTLGWNQVPVADLRSHLDAWARAGQVGERVLHDEREKLYEVCRWVPPEVTPLRGAELSSAEEGRQYLLDWVRMPAVRLCAVLGDTGEGKTFLCRMWSARLLELREAGEQSWPVPLYLDMRNLPVWKEERVPRLEEMLEHLLKEAGFGELPAAGVLAAVRRGHVVLIFDGFDEHSVHLTDAQATDLMRQIRAAAPPDSQGKVLVTCRTHYFLDRANEQEKVRGGGVRTREGFEAGDFAIAYLQPFDEKRIRAYLLKVLGDEADKAFEFMKHVHDLVDLGKRPVLLAMIASNLEHLERRAKAGERVKVGDIYEAAVELWLERDTGKHLVFPELKVALMQDLARRLWIAGGGDASLHYKDLRTWLPGRISGTGLVGRIEDMWRIDADLRTATFLVRDPTGNYRFAHTSFLEFFLARGVTLGLSEERADALDLPRLNKEMLEFTVDLLHGERGDTKSAAQLVSTVLEGAYRRQRSENAVLLLVAWQRLRPETAPCPAEIHLEGAQLHGAELARGQLSGARLSGANLERAVLTEAKVKGSDLHGADLRHVSARSADLSGACLAESRLDFADLVCACLRGCDLSRARGSAALLQRSDCTGARFDQAALPYARLARARLLAAQLSQGDFRNASLPEVSASQLALVPLLGHGGSVGSIAFSPDGVALASGSHDGTIKIWETARGRLVRSLEAYGTSVFCVTFSADGAMIASGNSRYHVELRHAATGRVVRTLEHHTGNVLSVAFSPDGATLASGSDDTSVNLWDPAAGRLLRTLEGHGGLVCSIAFSPDVATIASGSSGGSVKIWEVTTGRLVRSLEGHRAAVCGVAFSPDGATIASASDDKSVKVWEATTGRLIRTLGDNRDWVLCVAFSPDGATLASGGADNTVKFWEAATGRLVRTLEGHGGWVLRVAFSPDGATLASGSSDRSVRLWEAATGRLVRTLEAHRDWVRSVAVSPDGATLASKAYEGKVVIWDARTGSLLHEGDERLMPPAGCQLTRSGGLVAATSPAGTVRICEASSEQTVVTLAAWNSEEWVVWTPDGYFDAPRAAWHRIGVTDGLVSYPVEEFAEHFHRPDIIRERLAKAREGG